MNKSVTLLITLSIFFIASCSEPSNATPHSKYSEEQYTLQNGTPCIIIRGGTHSGMVGVTCNYGH